MLPTLFKLVVAMTLGAGFDLPRDNRHILHYYSKGNESGIVRIDDTCYNHTELARIDNGHALDAHYDSYGNLFYVVAARMDDGFDYDIYVLKANESFPRTVKGIPRGRGYSIAVDRRRDQVLFGTRDGIFRYNYIDNSAFIHKLRDHHIGMIFVDREGEIYVTELVDGEDSLFLVINNKKVPARRIGYISDMAIDDADNIYYIKDNELYLLKNDSLSSRLVCELPFNGIGQINFDDHGRLYVASGGLRYLDDYKTARLTVVENIPDNLTCLAFNKYGNFVLGTFNRLIKYERMVCKDELAAKP